MAQKVIGLIKLQIPPEKLLRHRPSAPRSVSTASTLSVH